MDLKEWPHDKNVWLLRMIDQSRHQILISRIPKRKIQLLKNISVSDWIFWLPKKIMGNG